MTEIGNCRHGRPLTSACDVCVWLAESAYRDERCTCDSACPIHPDGHHVGGVLWNTYPGTVHNAITLPTSRSLLGYSGFTLITTPFRVKPEDVA